MKLLVTGGAGYVGSHTCMKLAEAGHEIVVVDNLSAGHPDFVKWGKLVEQDLLDTDGLIRTFKEAKPDAVLHLASLINVGESVQNPDLYHHVNVGGTESLLHAMRTTGVERLVFSSSCAIYGMPKVSPLTEAESFKPINPYGETKLKAELLFRAASQEWGLRSMSLRYFNAAGADPQARIGEHHSPETHLIPLVLDSIMSRKHHVAVFGTDYPTRDGTCIRDYVHVCDLADAHRLALIFLSDPKAQGNEKAHAVNLGSEAGHSVREVIQAAETVTQQKVPVQFGPRRAGDPPILVANSSRAREILGWKAQYTDLRETITHAWNWHQKRFSN